MSLCYLNTMCVYFELLPPLTPWISSIFFNFIFRVSICACADGRYYDMTELEIDMNMRSGE